ncbi:hypothetical protein HOLleu_29597 [Holothuria leucospilota]|uniref:Uncharacterized protein n=1 Tax=Holothuria leucospilota TaxID=206669 RepID=A0A9Q1H1G6_HOLLE|nr:hypothetical protein HOLleu_29597 [Holothuria leucospilota]
MIGVTKLCSIRSPCRNRRRRFHSLTRSNRRDPSAYEATEEDDKHRYFSIHDSLVQMKNNPDYDLKTESEDEGTNLEKGILKDAENCAAYGQTTVTAVVEKSSVDDGFMNRMAQKSVTSFMSGAESVLKKDGTVVHEDNGGDNGKVMEDQVTEAEKHKIDQADCRELTLRDTCSEDHKLSKSVIIPEIMHPSNSAGKGDQKSELIKDCRGDKNLTASSENRNLTSMDVASGDAYQEATSMAGKSDRQLEEGRIEQGDKMGDTGQQSKITSESEDDEYDDFEDLNAILNHSDFNLNKKPELIKISAEKIGSKVIEPMTEPAELYDETCVDVTANNLYEDLDYLSRSGKEAESAPKLNRHKKTSDPYVEPNVCLERRKAIKKKSYALYGQPYSNSFDEPDPCSDETGSSKNGRSYERKMNVNAAGSNTDDIMTINSKGSRIPLATRRNDKVVKHYACKQTTPYKTAHVVDVNTINDDECMSEGTSTHHQKQVLQGLVELYDDTSIDVSVKYGNTNGKVDIIDCYGETYDDTVVAEFAKSAPLTLLINEDIPAKTSEDLYEETLEMETGSDLYGDTSVDVYDDTSVDVYDDTSVDEGGRSNTTIAKENNSNVAAQQEIYDENYIESHQKYLNKENGISAIPIKPEIRKIPNDETDLYMDADMPVTEQTSDIYEMIPAESHPSVKEQSSVFHNFRKKNFFKGRKQKKKKTSARKPCPVPLDISTSHKQIVETNVDDDTYEELPEGYKPGDIS